MAYTYERTADPLYLAVPQDLVVKALGQREANFGTRATGQIFNHMPWFLAALSSRGNPEPEPELDLSVSPADVHMTRGASTRINISLRNSGTDPVEDIRLSFRPRFDFSATPVDSMPVKLDPGKSAEVAFDLTAPPQLNLTCHYKRIAYGHASMSYRRGNAAHVAHASFQVVVE